MNGLRKVVPANPSVTELKPALPLRGRIPELDGVRGLAILMVLIFHYVEIVPAKHSLAYYALAPIHLMWSGVDLFFVLSGFLIGGILLDHRQSPNYFKTFYARRVFRIFPLYYLLATGLAIGPLIVPGSALFRSATPAWTFFVFGQNVASWFTRSFGSIWSGVTWSLAVEEQFYLLLPLCVWLLPPTKLKHLICFCILGAPLLRSYLVFTGHTFEQVHPLLPCRADALGLGVFAAMVVRSASATGWIRSHASLGYIVFGVLMAASSTLLKWASYGYSATVGYSILGCTYFLLILLLLIRPLKPLKEMFSMPWLRWLGTISYCVYLIHEPVRYSVSRLVNIHILVVPLSLIATLALAQLSWQMEKRLVAFAHATWGYGPPKAAATSASHIIMLAH